MSVVKKRSGSKYYYYQSGRNGTGIRKCLFVTRLEDAKRLQLELDIHRAKVRNGLAVVLVEIRLSDAVDNWIKIIEGKKEKDVKSFKRSAHSWYKKQLGHIKKFLSFKGDQLVHTISTADIIEYKTWLLNQYANKTSRDYLLTLKEFFDWCKIKAYLGMHPYDNTGKAFFPSKKPTNPRRPVRIKDIKWAIENAENEKDKIFWSIMLYSNLRKVDAGSLTLNYIKQGVVTNKSKTPIPILLPRDFRDNPDKAVMVMPLEKDQRKSLARYQALMKTKGYETDFHAIRHSVATYLSQCGYNQEDVKRICGWSSNAVENYIHTGSHELSDLLDKIK